MANVCLRRGHNAPAHGRLLFVKRGPRTSRLPKAGSVDGDDISGGRDAALVDATRRYDTLGAQACPDVWLESPWSFLVDMMHMVGT